MGQVIEFYRPQPKPVDKANWDKQVAAEQDIAAIPAKDILGLAATQCVGITDVLIMTRDSNGEMGFLTNVDGLAESLLFIERVKLRMMNKDIEDNTPTPTGGAA